VHQVPHEDYKFHNFVANMPYSWHINV